MTQLIDPTSPAASPQTDLVAEVHRVLAASPEPLTLSKIRAALPADFRRISLEELADVLRRQVAANALQQYPKYRSQQDRFWDRSMPVHIATLLRTALEEGPLGWSELRRRLPAYAQAQAETVLQEQLAQGMLYRYPRAGGQRGERFGNQPPDPKDYLRTELAEVFCRLEQLGFNQARLREAALEMLHDEEWKPAPATPAPLATQPPHMLAEQPRAATPLATENQP